MKIVDTLTDQILTEAGSIANLSFNDFNHIAVIKSLKDTERSNHYHKTTSHWLYVVSGGMMYKERDLDGSNVEQEWVGEGQMVYTPPNRVHVCCFPVDTVLISMTDNSSQSAHEEDRIKEQF